MRRVKDQLDRAALALFVFDDRQHPVAAGLRREDHDGIRVLLQLAGLTQVRHRRCAAALLPFFGARQLRQRDHGDAGPLRHRVQRQRDVGHLLDAGASLCLQQLHVVDDDHVVPPRHGDRLHVGDAETASADDIKVDVLRRLDRGRCRLVVVQHHPVALDAAKVDALRLCHHAIVQLGVRGLEAKYPDAQSRPRHVHRKLRRQQRLAAARQSTEDDQVAALGVEPLV